MKKVVPVLGLIIFLVIIGVWLSRPSAPLSAGSVTAQETESQTGESESSTEESPAADEIVDTGSTETSLEPVAIPEGFSQVPYLSEEQLQVFENATDVLEPGKDYQAIIETNKGVLVADLFEDMVPVTVNNFVFLALHKYYDGIVFHRVLEDFMAQTGDPTGTGRGGPGYTFADEFDSSLRHNKPGILSMANSGPNTNGSQFFITFVETPWLDDRHSVFGEIISGSEVLEQLTRIDPSNNVPGVIVNLDAPLSELKAKGVEVEGNDSQTVEAYLIESQGSLPEMGTGFKLNDLDAVIGRVGETPALGVYLSSPDQMTRVTIIERPVEQ